MYEQDTGKAIGPDPAQNYERFFVPSIGLPVSRDLLEAAALRPGQRVLDVACGTGIVARQAAQAVGPNGAVTAIDINEAMLAVARRLPAEGAKIQWRVDDAQDLTLADHSFDVVLCQMGLQFVPDQAGAVREMQRVLSPGGDAWVSTPGRIGPLFEALHDALGHHVGGEAAGFVQAVFSLHDEDRLAGLLEGAGFQHVQVQTIDKSLVLPPPARALWEYVGSTPLAGAVAGLDADTRQALEDDVVSAWQPFVEDGKTVYEQTIVQVHGVK